MRNVRTAIWIPVESRWPSEHFPSFNDHLFISLRLIRHNDRCLVPRSDIAPVGRWKTVKSQTPTLAPSSGSCPNCRLSPSRRAGSLVCCPWVAPKSAGLGFHRYTTPHRRRSVEHTRWKIQLLNILWSKFFTYQRHNIITWLTCKKPAQDQSKDINRGSVSWEGVR